MHILKSLTIAAALGTIVVVSLNSIGAEAHSGAKGVVKERMDLMGVLKDAMKQLTAMFADQQPYDPAKVRSAALVLRDHAGKQMTKLFPEGPVHKPSEALPTIWKNWSEFDGLAEDLAVYATVLSETAAKERGPKMMGQSGMMGHGTMMGKGSMMGPGAMMGQSGMMGQSAMMGQGHMRAGTASARADMLKTMPADASFMMVSNTCSACHTKFRLKK